MREPMLQPLEELVQIQEEPALDIALPQVFVRPELPVLQRGKIPNVERLAARLHRVHVEQNGVSPVPILPSSGDESQRTVSLKKSALPRRNDIAKWYGVSALGQDYQALVNEFQPLFTWAMACWDYLLSTEGCRFVLRNGDEKCYSRGDYRAVSDKDYSRLVHRIFRQCVWEFAQTPLEQSLASFLRTRFWDAVVLAYRKLEDPPDPCQRRLTAYSYLRCIPYQFLNDFHHELVYRTVQQLPPRAQQAIDLYFLHFYTLHATAQAMGLPVEASEETLRRGLLTLLIDNRLVYCLLRQIERY